MPVAEQRGGAELALTHLMQERTPSITWSVAFLEDGPMIDQYRSMGVDVHLIESGQLREMGRFAWTVRRLAAIAREERIDAVMSWMGKPHLYGGLAARMAGVPALWYQHGLPKTRNMIDSMIAAVPARGILACSGTVADAQREMGSTCPIEVAYPGVELNRCDEAQKTSPRETRLALGLPVDGPLIGMVGRLQRWKGMHVLVEAMRTVLDRRPDAHCVIVGGEHSLEPDYPAMLNRRIDEVGLQGKVTLAGLKRNIPEWMQAMDVFVHASDNEPFGMVIIEAMALGKPVIAGNAGGPTEIVTDGVDGLLCRYGDSAALASAILRVLADPVLALSLGAEAKRRAQDFSTVHYARSVETAVAQLVAQTEMWNRTANVTHA